MTDYYGITHPFGARIFCNKFFFWIWRKMMCKKNIHLFDEVWSPDKHCLCCDACDLTVNIKSIDLEDVKK